MTVLQILFLFKNVEIIKEEELFKELGLKSVCYLAFLTLFCVISGSHHPYHFVSRKTL